METETLRDAAERRTEKIIDGSLKGESAHCQRHQRHITQRVTRHITRHSLGASLGTSLGTLGDARLAAPGHTVIAISRYK